MLVIKSRYQTRKSGSGVFGRIFKKISEKITKDGLTKVINKATSSAVAHKVADAVLRGATSATEKVVESAIVDTLKRKQQQPTTEKKKKKEGTKKIKLDITDLVNGSGIVLD